MPLVRSCFFDLVLPQSRRSFLFLFFYPVPLDFGMMGIGSGHRSRSKKKKEKKKWRPVATRVATAPEEKSSAFPPWSASRKLGKKKGILNANSPRGNPRGEDTPCYTPTMGSPRAIYRVSRFFTEFFRVRSPTRALPLLIGFLLFFLSFFLFCFFMISPRFWGRHFCAPVGASFLRRHILRHATANSSLPL